MVVLNWGLLGKGGLERTGEYRRVPKKGGGVNIRLGGPISFSREDIFSYFLPFFFGGGALFPEN